MNTELLLESIKKTKEYKDLSERFSELKKRYEEEKNEKSGKLPLLINGVSGGAELSLVYSLVKDNYRKYKSPLLILMGDERKANKLNDFLKKSGALCEFYPYRDFNFYEMTASREIEHERLKVLSSIAFSSVEAVVTTPGALLQYTMPEEELKKRTFGIKMGDIIDKDDLIGKLIGTGYIGSELVENPGQFAQRGGIIDVFPTECEYICNGETSKGSVPVRIELFGDEVDRIEIFDGMTQRMTKRIDSFSVTPSREIIPSESQLSEIGQIIGELKSECKKEETVKELERELFALEHFTADSFFDKFISLVYKQKECLLDYFGSNDSVIVINYNSVLERAKEAEEINNENAKSLTEEGLIVSEYASYGTNSEALENFLDMHIMFRIDSFISHSSKESGGVYGFNTKSIAGANHSLDTIIDELRLLSEESYSSVLVCRNDTEAKTAIKALNECKIPSYPATDKKADDIAAGTVGVICDTLPDGYEIPSIKFAVIVLSSMEREVTKTSIRKNEFAKNSGEKILSYNDLNVGDYVVHASYGIGKYTGIANLCVCGAYRDYVCIQYAGSDKLYLPVDQLDLVAKFIGAKSADGAVRLSKMGGAEWKKSTQRAKSAAKDMAKELISLYAKRIKIRGFSFLPDGIMEREFDNDFEYEETPSQLLAIQEVKSDMEKPYPMDRVLCGDVGYGKTEVAFRAAMKAIANGKQVAMLVPTTILAMQHYQTALTRFAGTGVSIDMISRFKTAKQQSLSMRKLARGDTDFIIGTHKLLNSKLKFHDLGLLIVDEEQRFGVAQKEKIKQTCVDVDVLSLSATPIPRTLSMAMGGIRDMSVLDDAPGGRIGVNSYVLEYDENIIKDAIRRELHRGGQVFYLYNNVEQIYRVASKLKTFFPDARIAVAHGQMDRDQIEGIWQNLVKGEVDILVSTTIIETGIDIPNANTLIIENADRMGLSQLHQIRGRVGRSARRAYAYFTFRKGKEISEIAEKRLSAIRDFAQFGAGFKIAMRDLEIRGAGDLLGSQQHGHLEAVGYDMYIRLLNEAVSEEKGEEVKENFETLINLSRDAFLPKSYIKSSLQRMDMYKKIAHIRNEEDLKDIEEELRDRFGEIPTIAKNLLESAIVKAYAKEARIKKVDQMREEVRLYPNEINLFALSEISRVDRDNVSVCGVGKVPYISVKIDPGKPFYEKVVKVIKLYTEKCIKSAEKL